MTDLFEFIAEIFCMHVARCIYLTELMSVIQYFT